jgi:hypothetical protein
MGEGSRLQGSGNWLHTSEVVVAQRFLARGSGKKVVPAPTPPGGDGQPKQWTQGRDSTQPATI